MHSDSSSGTYLAMSEAESFGPFPLVVTGLLHRRLQASGIAYVHLGNEGAILVL